MATARWSGVMVGSRDKPTSGDERVLREHGKVEKLETIVARQQKQIEALTAGLQKVSAQVELTKSRPQTVLNNR
jgi:hypothetical protein